MSALDDLLKKHRQRVLAGDRQAFDELLAAYESVRDDLRRQLRQIARRMKAARDRGEVLSPSWLYKERRLNELVDQVNDEILRFGRVLADVTTRHQRSAITIARDQTREIFQLTTEPIPNVGSMLPTRAVETVVGLMGDGSPIYAYWAENVAPSVAEALKKELLRAVSTGADFRSVTRNLMKTGDITRHRALAIARTEVQRVRREATRAIYQDNDDIISGWEWVAAKSRRTCAACLAMDGRRFKLKDEFPQHPNCRCTMIPVLIDVEMPPRTNGTEWFERQPDDVKEEILGRDGFRMYADGQLKLADMVGWKNHKLFGRSIYKRSLARVINAVELP